MDDKTYMVCRHYLKEKEDRDLSFFVEYSRGRRTVGEAREAFLIPFWRAGFITFLIAGSALTLGFLAFLPLLLLVPGIATTTLCGVRRYNRRWAAILPEHAAALYLELI